MTHILNYEEITPCLRDVTKEWEDMINDSNRPHIQFSHQSLLKCVQQGKLKLTVHVNDLVTVYFVRYVATLLHMYL